MEEKILEILKQVFELENVDEPEEIAEMKSFKDIKKILQGK